MVKNNQYAEVIKLHTLLSFSSEPSYTLPKISLSRKSQLLPLIIWGNATVHIWLNSIVKGYDSESATRHAFSIVINKEDK